MNTTPAGNEPNRPDGGPLAPTAPGNAPTLQPLTRTQKILTGVVVGAVLVIATLGFIGSYTAVTHLAINKGFGEFAHAFPIAVDAGIIAFLALDLLLTWRRIAFPLLRYTAWGLTLATISFNAVVSWPDPVGTGMHGVIPVLFVIAVEAARHAVGRIAEITADKHLEGPNPSCWFLNPVGTFILWRRQRLWGIRTWQQVLDLEQERRIFKGKLRNQYGRTWRRTAAPDQLLILRLATKDGLSITDAMALPEKEAAKQRAKQQQLANEQREAENKRRREQEAYEREQKRLDEEAAAKAEAERLENERKALALQQQKDEAERARIVADAQTRAQLAEISRAQQEADAEAERRRKQEQLEHARAVTAEQERAAAAAKRRLADEQAAAQAAADKEAANLRAAQIVQRASANAAAASASQMYASRPASASRPTASQPATPATTEAASATSPASASPAATSPGTTSASTNQAAATSASTGASDDYIQKVVDVYQLLEQREGKAPSDQKLGDALGVSRSRAQQLRTAAIDAGHTELAKPMRIAS